MPRRLNLPDTASVATPDGDGKLFAPSADRNADFIVALVRERAPTHGRALELASGTGQHVVTLARAMPDMHWHPTDIDISRRASIDAYVRDANLSNVAPASELDATRAGWSATNTGYDLILLVNLLHLISAAEAQTVIREAAKALAPSGMLIVYGPFMRDDELTSEGDAAFHASLQAQDPEIGYKSDFDVLDWGVDAWLDVADVVEMPANNLALCWRKAGT